MPANQEIAMLIGAERLEHLVRDIFQAEGSSAEESARIALYLVRANLAGHDSHGVIRVPRYVDWKREGLIVPNQSLDILTETDSLAVADGRYGFGQSIGPQGGQLGIDKATRSGVAIRALRHSAPPGRIGEGPGLPAEAGLACRR